LDITVLNMELLTFAN